MDSSKSSAGETSQPRREQIDELDALLERMLALPVGLSEPDTPLDSQPATHIPPVEFTEPSTETICRESEPAIVPMEQPNQPPASFVASQSRSMTEIQVAPRALSFSRPPIPYWIRPLIWLNRQFDRQILRLGALGRWLRRRHGRAFLGVVGILCFLTALAIVLHDWIGWTR